MGCDTLSGDLAVLRTQGKCRTDASRNCQQPTPCQDLAETPNLDNQAAWPPHCSRHSISKPYVYRSGNQIGITQAGQQLMTKPHENETPVSVNTEPPNFTAVVESQSAVTHRMIGLRRGRTRKSRFLKLAAIGSIFALTVVCTWWVLSHFKEENQSWSELFVHVVQRLST